MYIFLFMAQYVDGYGQHFVLSIKIVYNREKRFAQNMA